MEGGRVGRWCSEKLSQVGGVMDLVMFIGNLLVLFVSVLLFPQSHIVAGPTDSGSTFCNNTMIISTVTLFFSAVTFGMHFIKPIDSSRATRWFAWQLVGYVALCLSSNLFSFVWILAGIVLDPIKCGTSGTPNLIIIATTVLINSTVITAAIFYHHWYQAPIIQAEEDPDMAAAVDASLRHQSTPPSHAIIISQAEHLHGIIDAYPTIPPPNPSASPATNLSGLGSHPFVGSWPSLPGCVVDEKKSAGGKEKKSVGNGDGGNCVICLSELWTFEGGSLAPVKQVVNCGHLFHAKCLMPWVLAHQNTCPLCRTTVILEK